MTISRLIGLFAIITASGFTLSQAQTIGKQAVGSNSGYVIPRFASLASDTVNMRTGPSENYKISWHFIRDNLPVEIIFEQTEWRKVRVSDGTTGWMHRSVLNGTRTGIITAETTPLYDAPDTNSDNRAFLKQGVVVIMNECQKKWCKINTDGVSGWLPKNSFWGVYKDETL